MTGHATPSLYLDCSPETPVISLRGLTFGSFIEKWQFFLIRFQWSQFPRRKQHNKSSKNCIRRISCREIMDQKNQTIFTPQLVCPYSLCRLSHCSGVWVLFGTWSQGCRRLQVWVLLQRHALLHINQRLIGEGFVEAARRETNQD